MNTKERLFVVRDWNGTTASYQRTREEWQLAKAMHPKERFSVRDWGNGWRRALAAVWGSRW